MRGLSLILLLVIAPMVQGKGLEKRVEALEVERALDIFNFSGRLDTQYFKLKNPQGDKLDLYRLRSSLNVNADVSSKIKFYSRYTMSKYFNTYTQENLAPHMIDSLAGSSSFRGSKLVVERAYFDYFFNIPLALSLGRLPTFGGEPLNFYDNLPAQSTYPMMAYNAEFDGIALSYDLYKRLPRNHQASLRMIYTPTSHLNYSNTNFPLTLPTGVDGGKMTSSSIATAVAEYSIMNRKSFLDDWRLKIFYSRLDRISFADVILPAAPSAGGILTTAPVLRFPNKMMDISFFSVHNHFSNVAKLGLDIHTSLFFSRVANNKLASLIGGRSLGLRRDGLGTATGRSLLISLKKRTSFSFLNKPSFGLEYFKGSKNYFSPTLLGSTEDASGFYETMGNAWHFFYLQPIEDQFSMRLGFRTQQADYKPNRATQFGLGSAIPVNENISSYYLNFLLYF